MFDAINRRDFSIRLAALAGAAALPLQGRDDDHRRDRRDQEGGGSVTDAEAIRMRQTFLARPRRVFEALTEEEDFNRLQRLASRVGMLGIKPVSISRIEGGEFQLFNGRVTGRHIELLPGERLVQAWRMDAWERGVYSIAHFEFEGRRDETTVYLDHTGFPRGEGQHLLDFWTNSYWEPLRKLLA